MSNLIKFQEYDGHGGPSSTTQGGDGYAKTSTTTGRFVVKSIAKHVSYGKYKLWSGVAWGTEMQFSGHLVKVKIRGQWINLTQVNEDWKKYEKNQKDVFDEIVRVYRSMYPTGSLPTQWVFNDFGHVSIKYFKDLNNDRRMNGKEQILGDFIHTTPPDEAMTARGISFNLSESHGCIHVRPKDIDTIIESNYVAIGNTVEVHPYSESVVPNSLSRNADGRTYELHFFPGALKLVVYRVH